LRFQPVLELPQLAVGRRNRSARILCGDWSCLTRFASLKPSGFRIGTERRPFAPTGLRGRRGKAPRQFIQARRSVRSLGEGTRKSRSGTDDQWIRSGSTSFDSILVGYYAGSDLMYAGRIRNGFPPASRRTVFSNFEGLSISKCPFRNLPESGKSRWGEGLTAEDMKRCRWLKPQTGRDRVP
jgi:hypothetical protein